MLKVTGISLILIFIFLSACSSTTTVTPPAKTVTFTPVPQTISVPSVPQVAPVTAKVFVGSVNSDKYHKPSCEWAKKILPANEVWFSSAQDAQSNGYQACKVCKP